MPKQKTHRGAAKRFSLTATGKVKHAQANRRHKFTEKTAKRKRQLRATGQVFVGEAKIIKTMLPYA